MYIEWPPIWQPLCGLPHWQPCDSIGKVFLFDTAHVKRSRPEKSEPSLTPLGSGRMTTHHPGTSTATDELNSCSIISDPSKIEEPQDPLAYLPGIWNANMIAGLAKAAVLWSTTSVEMLRVSTWLTAVFTWVSEKNWVAVSWQAPMFLQVIIAIFLNLQPWMLSFI